MENITSKEAKQAFQGNFVHPSWTKIILENIVAVHGAKIKELVDYTGSAGLSPAPYKMFRAFELTPLDEVKVVLVGQDPYPDRDVATGLAFGNPKDKFVPAASLKSMINLLSKDYDVSKFDITLESWAKQGVLLLNSALTCEKGKPGTHVGFWSPIVKSILNGIVSHSPSVLVVSFGKQAQAVVPKEANTLHAPHPMTDIYPRRTPMQVQFRDSDIFNKINERLAHKIQWV